MAENVNGTSQEEYINIHFNIVQVRGEKGQAGSGARGW